MSQPPPNHARPDTLAPSPRVLSEDLRARLRPIELLCLDVDGVLSDGHLYFMSDGSWAQRFAVRDGVGIKLLMQAGVTVAILSEGGIASGKARAQSLGITRAYFGIKDKRERFGELIGELGLTAAQAAFVGDEVSDLPLLRAVGFSATVPDAVDEVLGAVHYVTRRPGGGGAVREVADLIRAHRA